MLDLQQLFKTKKFRDSRSITTYDMYSIFPHKNKYSKRDFVFILSIYNQILLEYLIYTGHAIRLPKRLGTLSIRRFTSSRKIVDYRSYHDGDNDVYYYNAPGMEYEGVTFYWDKRSPYCLHPLKALYKYVPTREGKSKLGNYLLQNPDLGKYYTK